MKLPAEFESRMKNMLKNEYTDFYNGFTKAPIFAGIRINTLKKGSREAVKREFGNLEPIKWCRDGYYIEKGSISGNHPYHMAGLFYFQEPSAMCAADGMEIHKGDFVLDLCAAPGGKTTQAGAKLEGTGLLMTNEIVKKRAAILAENTERFGLTNTIVTNETPEILSEKYPGFFDKIIVDAPCSGEGMFRKEPQAITEWSPEHVLSCAKRQRHILDCAVKMLKRGGQLIYSTCTFSTEENEENALYLIEKHGMRLTEMKNGAFLYPSKNEWIKEREDISSARRIFPHTQNGEGHFAALFTKNSSDDNFCGKTKKTSKKENPALKEKVFLFRDFENRFLNTYLTGSFTAFGDNLYLMPYDIDIDKIKTVRPGLHLGVCKKGRFEPSHGLCLALTSDDFKSCMNFSPSSRSLSMYMSGHTLESEIKGWCAVCVDGFPLGWGKGDGRILKNHYPKKLRIPSVI